MEIEQNKSLNIMDSLSMAYLVVAKNLKQVIIGSYILAAFAFLMSFLMPQIPTQPGPDNYLTFLPFLALSILIFIFLNVFFYRLFSLESGQLLKIKINDLIKAIVKLILYTAAIVFLILIAMVALLILVGLIIMIVNEVAGQPVFNNTILMYIVNLAMLAITLLIIMRLQPTFISIAIGEPTLPMKSSFYYTRDNNKQLVMIGLLAFIPAMMPMLIAYWIIEILNLATLSQNVVALVLFPLLMIPVSVVMSAGVEVKEKLVPKIQDQKGAV